ncbi:flagellar biosynthesis protein FlhF [bacterium BMS3Abin03]|nr:flagellar biosynthesis protein FlhF [bacterium BMS3Abin03]
MQLKKYVAQTLKSATEQMKTELGDEAIILGTRVLHDSRYPGGKMFELTAGIDDEADYSNSSNMPHPANDGAYKSFEEELKKISGKVSQSTSGIDKKSGLQKPDDKHRGITNSAKPIRKVIEETVERLKDKEIDKPIIKKIILQLKKYGKFLQPAELNNYIITGISTMIPTETFSVSKGRKPKVVALVGPTGVGKTTCIAKLAIISKIIHELDVGLISIDTYRIGALDQLKVFSEVSSIDMLVAYEADELTGIMKEFRNKDVIFIDTAGRSQKNSEFLIKAKKFLQKANIDDTYLVMSSTSSTRTLLDISEKFKIFDYNSLIFTKIDEGVVFGNILNLITKINVPAVFLANGQVIPDDIISADADYMARLIYTGKIF